MNKVATVQTQLCVGGLCIYTHNREVCEAQQLGMLLKRTKALGLGRSPPEEPFDGYAAWQFAVSLNLLRSADDFVCNLRYQFHYDIEWAFKELKSPLYD